jgi:hypothetical protein
MKSAGDARRSEVTAEMTEADIQHFLIVYDIPSGKAQVRDFGTDYEAALGAYAEIEGEMRERDDLDIVLVGADSLETVKRTHSSYFGDTAETFESLLPAGVLAR